MKTLAPPLSSSLKEAMLKEDADGGWTFYNLNRMNTTTVNNECAYMGRKLQHGDLVQIGEETVEQDGNLIVSPLRWSFMESGRQLVASVPFPTDGVFSDLKGAKRLAAGPQPGGDTKRARTFPTFAMTVNVNSKENAFLSGIYMAARGVEMCFFGAGDIAFSVLAVYQQTIAANKGAAVVVPAHTPHTPPADPKEKAFFSDTYLAAREVGACFFEAGEIAIQGLAIYKQMAPAAAAAVVPAAAAAVVPAAAAAGAVVQGAALALAIYQQMAPAAADAMVPAGAAAAVVPAAVVPAAAVAAAAVAAAAAAVVPAAAGAAVPAGAAAAGAAVPTLADQLTAVISPETAARAAAAGVAAGKEASMKKLDEAKIVFADASKQVSWKYVSKVRAEKIYQYARNAYAMVMIEVEFGGGDELQQKQQTAWAHMQNTYKTAMKMVVVWRSASMEFDRAKAIYVYWVAAVRACVQKIVKTEDSEEVEVTGMKSAEEVMEERKQKAITKGDYADLT